MKNSKKQIEAKISHLQDTLKKNIPAHIRKQTLKRIDHLIDCLNGKHHFVKMMFADMNFKFSDSVFCCEYCHKKKPEPKN